MKNTLYMICIVVTFLACADDSKVISDDSFSSILKEGIEGHKDYLHTSYITAGDRLYSIGSQDGGFPEIGWHIAGEMGGIWSHPIKLLDGYEVIFYNQDDTLSLDQADRFVNYPVANQHFYHSEHMGLEVTRTQYIPDGLSGMVVEISVHNQQSTDAEMFLHLKSHFDLRPTWLGERTEMIDSTDEIRWDNDGHYFLAHDQGNEWWAMMGTSLGNPVNQGSETSPYQTKGRTGNAVYKFVVPASDETRFYIYIAGSDRSLQVAQEQYEELTKNPVGLLDQKLERYARLQNRSLLSTPDTTLDTQFRWLKYASDWFVRDVPEIGKGIAAGYPDYPWFFGCDSEYALQGYLSIGNFELVKETIDLLAHHSELTNDNGRIIHEMSTNGAVYNPGNVNETPQFASLVWTYYKWTGDKKTLDKYYPLVKRGLYWLLTEKDTNGNLFPEGAGMMEIHGLESEMIDVAAYTQRALADAARMADVLGNSDDQTYYDSLATELKERINHDFWSEHFKSYADFISSDSEALHLIDAAIVRADTLDKPWAVEELRETKKYIQSHPSTVDRPFVLYHNWVVNTPLEMGIAPDSKAKEALETASQFVNPFGTFVTGIDRDEESENEDGSFAGSKVFSYTGAVMTLPTGVSAISEANYGDADAALDYITRMGRSFSFALPGSMYEVSPDYGMFAQAWNLYGYAVPIVTQFFGINPDAANKTIYLSPLMPSGWSDAQLKNVRVGDNEFSFTYTREKEKEIMEVISKRSGWTIIYSDSDENEQREKVKQGINTFYF